VRVTEERRRQTVGRGQAAKLEKALLLRAKKSSEVGHE